MIDSPTGVGRIKAGTPEGWTVAHKTGTSGKGQINDIGVLYPPMGEPIRIAVYYDGSLDALPEWTARLSWPRRTRRAIKALGREPAHDRRARQVMMKDGMARPTGGDIRGWLMRGEVGMASA